MSAQIKVDGTVVSGKMCNVLTKAGQVGMVMDSTVSSYNGHIILRTYDSFVSLTNPEHTWTNILKVDLNVVVLPVGTVVEYTSEK